MLGIQIRCERGSRWPGGPAFLFRAIHGKGAGYVGGWTAYVAFRSGSLAMQRIHRDNFRRDGKRESLFSRVTRIQVGLTRNANLVPLM